jgi:uncharacterized repeat protein (TIGR03809 family)
MTQRDDAGRARDHHILNRWCKIAEQRLDYLVELYESGRWRRFHSEHAFTENILEAKAAVETWRALARREVTTNDQTIEGPTIDQPAETSPITQDETGQPSARLLGTAAVHAALASIVSLPEDTLVEANDDVPAEEQTASSAAMSAAIVPGQLTFQERYPMLRYNAL